MHASLHVSVTCMALSCMQYVIVNFKSWCSRDAICLMLYKYTHSTLETSRVSASCMHVKINVLGAIVANIGLSTIILHT